MPTMSIGNMPERDGGGGGLDIGIGCATGGCELSINLLWVHEVCMSRKSTIRDSKSC